MSKNLSITEIHERIRVWAELRIEPVRRALLVEDEWIDMVNAVARDMNNGAEIHVERYNNNTVSGVRNYEMLGEILSVHYFKYVHDSWRDQRWTHVNDVIVIKDDPASNKPKMDIIYLRDIREVVNSKTEEIDLPSYALFHFMDLLKLKMLVEYGDEDFINYDNRLKYVVSELRLNKVNSPIDSIGKFAYSATYSLSGHTYDITEQKVSQDSVGTLDTGEIIFL